MEYRLKNEENSAYKPIWFEINAVSKNKSIYVKDMEIKYDHLTDEYSSADHIDIRPQNYGGIEGITIIDPEYPQTERFRSTIEHLEI
ncbi:MAG: hypothetical protein EZS28_002978 [Streblomastix strix]|uniref:Uncharacterized protein n=1 Tax=Streblomastix strix TaxID=222440 RepID=A0A5J4X4A3_9EUKA|nr:MAG: hypothetical protein EZS28_002978 [Streblomastix strix]